MERVRKPATTCRGSTAIDSALPGRLPTRGDWRELGRRQGEEGRADGTGGDDR
jgi:hypothetical protein